MPNGGIGYWATHYWHLSYWATHYWSGPSRIPPFIGRIRRAIWRRLI